MQTSLSDALKDTPDGREADAILRSCVHCGFCTATCPTYQLLGDELDSPRGRIYLIKQVLEGGPVTEKTQLHLDRCLTCRSCETTCPSGVRYGRLVDIGRAMVEEKVPRTFVARVQRGVLRALIPYPRRFAALLRIGRWLRPLLPAALRSKLPAIQAAAPWPVARHARKMLVLDGCVQPAAAPNTNAAAARVLDKLGVSLIRAQGDGCCGALSHHLSAHDEALHFMRRNIDAWWPHIEAGAEAIVMTASGCGVVVKDYGVLLRDDPVYAAKAARISALTQDFSEILAGEKLESLNVNGGGRKVAFHAPCTLQHGQQINGVVETLLRRCGYQLTAVTNGHLCCGSAGTYSILQPELSQQLLADKLAALQAGAPDIIVTANIGCQLHLQSGAAAQVRHWVELLDGGR
ncbi:MAG: glycolate oxidase subunit GlcF [Pseudomonadota bacterium]